MSKVRHTLNIAFNNSEMNLKESKLLLIHEDDRNKPLTTEEVIEIGIVLLQTMLEDARMAGARIAHSKEE